MKTLPFIVALLLMGLVACKGTREGIKQDYKNTRDDVADVLTKSPEEIQREKDDLSSAIAVQRTKIEQDLTNIENKEFGEELARDVKYTSDKLEGQLASLEGCTERISQVSDDQWNDLKNEIEDTLDDMEDEREELTEKLYADLD